MIKTAYNRWSGKFRRVKMNNKNSLGGRPPGRKKTAKIEIVIEPEVKSEFMNLMRKEGKMASIEIGTWIKDYIKGMKGSETK